MNSRSKTSFMKNSLIKFSLMNGLVLFAFCASLHAQSLKQLFDTVTQNDQSHTGNKTVQANSNTANLASTPADTVIPYKVLQAFADAARQNPNDTSAGDMTMKALGLLAGGGGVSAADSAAAIKSFTAGSGGSGIVYQSITISTPAKGSTSKDTANLYLTNSGNARSEMRINMPGAMSNEMIVIGHASNPRYSVSLYPESKTYSLNIIDSSLLHSGLQTYRVIRIGIESSQGYRCIHSKLTTTSGSVIFKSTSAMDLWTSTEVPGYDIYKKLVSVQGYQAGMMQALDHAGCGGFIVKTEASGSGYSMSMQLIKAEKKNLPESLFDIPAGYKQSKGNMISHMVGR